MDGFERRKEQSKEDIRRAAEELFTRFGADKVSINDIALKAGVSQATIYNNFGSKEYLVRDYRKSVVKLIASRFREILVWKKSWVEKFHGFLQSWIDVADQYKMEIEESKSSDGSSLGIETQSNESIEREIENSFQAFIKEGRKQGNIRSNLSDEAIAAYIKFFRQGISNNPDIHDKMLRDSKLSRDIFSLFMYGVSGQSS